MFESREELGGTWTFENNKWSYNPKFILKETGAMQTFSTGSQRDIPGNKPRFGLLPFYVLERWAAHITKGAAKYGEDNWKRGQPLSRYQDSLLRHLYQWLNGDREEDHLAAMLFNVAGLMWTEAAVEAGTLPAELNDIRGLLDPPKGEEK